ncbi:hypothetical protein JTB14_031398 [Gonioctena quinquepunctata]|nr:hypothetical protein JTB14_031398 [Gonioctena quinquepunctata]
MAWAIPVEKIIADNFPKWAKELPYLLEIEIPRWIHAGFDDADNWSIHKFSAESYLWPRKVMESNEGKIGKIGKERKENASHYFAQL